MSKEELDRKIADLSKKVSTLGDKAKDAVETANIKGMYAKDEAKEKIEEKKKKHKGNIEALKENFRIFSDKVKGKASSELLKAQMNIDVAKEKLAEKKEAHNKAQMEDYIVDTVEYAEACVELSILAAEEAQLATLEAIAAQGEYEEKYGEKGE